MAAQAAKATAPPQFRVGDLIENGFLGDPKGWQLEGFTVVENRCISFGVKGGHEGSGTATTKFLGPDGHYKIRVRYLDENDGASRVALSVGGKEIGAWRFYGLMMTAYHWKEFDHVPIKKGDEIVLAGRKNRYEQCCIAGIEILPSTPPPPAVEAASIPKRDYSQKLVPLSSSRPARDYVVAPGPMFSGQDGTYWVYLKKNQVFKLTVWSRFADQAPTLQYSFAPLGATTPPPTTTLVSEEIMPIYLNLASSEEGVYELKVSGAPGSNSVRIDFAVPGVIRLPVAEGLEPENGYIYVPHGTTAFGVSALTGRLSMMNESGQVMLYEAFEKPLNYVVEVPRGNDGQVWFYQGKLKDIAGIPSYVAAHPDALLVPSEVLK